MSIKASDLSSGATVNLSRRRRALTVAPFLFSGFLFLSLIGSVLAPLPLLSLVLLGRTGLFFLALLTNSLAVYTLAGPLDTVVFVALVALPSLTMGTMLKRATRFEYAIGFALLTFWVALLALGAGYSLVTHQNPWHVLDQGMSQWLSQLKPSMISQMEPTGDLDLLKRKAMREIPVSFTLLALLSFALNFSIVLGLNWGGLRQRLGLMPGFFKEWRAPEWLVWPTILLGALAVFAPSKVADIGVGGLKFFLAIYVFQGLSILSFITDRFKVFGLFRSLLFGFMLFMGVPVLIAAGFFDLWFDFRSKMRQTQ